jgi:FkbM family methyltransferase
MVVNQFAHGRNARYSHRLLSCLVCQFALNVADEDGCPIPESEVVNSNASSLLQVHKPQPAVIARTVSGGNYLEAKFEEAKGFDGGDSKLDSRLREQLDKSILQDAKLRRVNMDLETKLVEEHDEVQRLKVMVERLYKDKMKDSLEQEPANKQTEDAPPRKDQMKDSLKQEPANKQTEDTPPRKEVSDGEAPCECEVEGSDWKRQAQRPPRCIFIDLGAADGNTFNRFLSNGFGDVSKCPSHGSYEAILVEANPVFNKPLQSLEKNFSGKVRSVISTAAYMCEGKTSFFLDTVDVDQHFWGSSMSPNARDVQRSGKRKVTVPLVNLNRLLWETAIKEDYVLVKMDVEGSEHDILPCLANSRSAELVDALYVEQHPVAWSRAGAQEGSLQRALTIFQERGVSTPAYDSPMF